MSKITFKKTIHTGKYKSFALDSTDMKLNKKVFGGIFETKNSQFKIQIALKKEKTEKDPASFKWVYVKETFATEDDAREYIIKKEGEIKKLDLYFFNN